MYCKSVLQLEIVQAVEKVGHTDMRKASKSQSYGYTCKRCQREITKDVKLQRCLSKSKAAQHGKVFLLVLYDVFRQTDNRKNDDNEDDDGKYRHKDL